MSAAVTVLVGDTAAIIEDADSRARSVSSTQRCGLVGFVFVIELHEELRFGGLPGRLHRHPGWRAAQILTVHRDNLFEAAGGTSNYETKEARFRMIEIPVTRVHLVRIAFAGRGRVLPRGVDWWDSIAPPVVRVILFRVGMRPLAEFSHVPAYFRS